MSHQDTDGLTGSCLNHQALKQALDWILASAKLSGLAFRGDCSWTPKALIFTALLWTWSDEKTLTKRFFLAARSSWSWGSSRGCPRRRTRLSSRCSEPGPPRSRSRWSPRFASGCRPISPNGSRCAGLRFSASMAVGSNCPAPNPTRRRFSPAKTDGGEPREQEAAFQVDIVGRDRGPSRATLRPREEDEQSADVADDDVSRRDRVALGLADRAVRQQRARPPVCKWSTPFPRMR